MVLMNNKIKLMWHVCGVCVCGVCGVWCVLCGVCGVCDVCGVWCVWCVVCVVWCVWCVWCVCVWGCVCVCVCVCVGGIYLRLEGGGCFDVSSGKGDREGKKEMFVCVG